MPLKLFKYLRDDDAKPKEVLRNQIKFKSDLQGIKIGSNKSEQQQKYNKKY